MNQNNNNHDDKFIRPMMGHSLRQFTKKRVAVYARVSRTGVLKHQSIEAQKKNLEADIAKHPGWVFAGYYVDEGITGTKLNRPEFNRMMEDARTGKLDIILTKTVSRFGRNTGAVLRVLQELKELDVIVIFDNEKISTADKNSFIRIQYGSIMAEREAKQNSDNKRWSIVNNYKQGIPITGRPYGYIMVDHQYHIVPEEAETIRRIFTMYDSGVGTRAICKALNAEGITTLKKAKWRPVTIYEIIRNEVYVGDLLLQKYYVENYLTKRNRRNKGELPQYLVTDAHEPIIDRQTFGRVQQEIARRREKYTHSKPSQENGHRLFSQLIRCEHCGCNIHYKLFKGSSVRKMWVCETHITQGPKFCSFKGIREDILTNTVREVLLTEKLIKEDTLLTNDLLKSHIRVIIAKANQELEFHMRNSIIITKAWQYPSRSKSWTPEMKQKARERALAQHAKKKEEQAHERHSKH